MPRIARIVLGLTIVLAASRALATAQIPDKIIHDGKEYPLLTNPMEAYFKEHPEKRPKVRLRSTALWRGYVATLEFKDRSLTLKDIEIEDDAPAGDEAWKSVKNEVVGKDAALAIDWFNGLLVLPDGERTRYMHMGYGSTYSRYILLEVRNGKLTGERKLDQQQYERFRERQFEAFRKTEEYRKIVAELAKRGDSQEFIDSFLRGFVVDYTSRFLDEPDSPASSGDAGTAPGPATRGSTQGENAPRQDP